MRIKPGYNVVRVNSHHFVCLDWKRRVRFGRGSGTVELINPKTFLWTVTQGDVRLAQGRPLREHLAMKGGIIAPSYIADDIVRPRHDLS